MPVATSSFRGHPVHVRDCGRMGYADALALQREVHRQVVQSRERGAASDAGTILFVEHDPPVITITRRPGAASHLLASSAELARRGIEVAETDRGGDITWHGPGQQVVYPILDLQRLGLRIHEYMRALEGTVIEALGSFGIRAARDEGATGVWAHPDPEAPAAKICAMGVRVSRWVTMHGLALNVDPDLSQFALIVPCGLAGRPVTSMRALLGDRTPTMAEVRQGLLEAFRGG